MEEYLLVLICALLMSITLWHIIHIKLKNKEKADKILYKSLGGTAFISYWSAAALLSDDELGILGYICYIWAIELALIINTKLLMKKENFLITLLFAGMLSSFFAILFNEPHWAYSVFAFPLYGYFIYYGIAKATEHKIQNKFPVIFSRLANLSLLLFCINILLLLGIAVFDHRLFRHITF